MERLKTGKIGENASTTYLAQKGYKIIERNCRLSFAEIDVVARKGNTLVFVEVKTINDLASGRRSSWNPEDNLTSRKRFVLKRAALHYMNRLLQQGEAVFDVRIDVITIRLIGGGRATLRHYKNALSI